MACIDEYNESNFTFRRTASAPNLETECTSKELEDVDILMSGYFTKKLHPFLGSLMTQLMLGILQQFLKNVEPRYRSLPGI